MANSTIQKLRRRLGARRVAELFAAAIIAVLLTAVISEMPKFEVLDAAIDDDNFTDLIQKTRGDLPIDTNIRVVIYDDSILDSFGMVDRATLAIQLAALLELNPRVVGVDLLIETERPEAPDGDEMLAALIGAHRNLIFGVFYEDSLRRFRLPPARFNLRPEQLGCINVQGDKDNTIRTFATIWGMEDSLRFEAFGVKVARWMDTAAIRYLESFSEDEFVIDYAAGIGETRRTTDGRGERIFPVMPLQTIVATMMSGDTTAIAFLRSQFAGKIVLAGYGDIGNTQVARIVDRFYTPLKEDDKNTLPDMHGVTIHANIINMILQERIIQVIPLWINLIWGTLLVLVMLAGREALQTLVPVPFRRTIASYTGFALLFLLGTLLPVLAFRFTPYKFSIYTPLAGLLLAVPAQEALERITGTIRDLRRRRRIGPPMPPSAHTGMHHILATWDVEKRMERAVHFLQMHFHLACDILFNEAVKTGVIVFNRTVIASPSLPGMLGAIDEQRPLLAQCSQQARDAVMVLEALAADPLLERTLRFSRSLYIALNEIRRQSYDGPGEPDASDGEEFKENVDRYADLALKALGERGGGDRTREFNALYAALERCMASIGEMRAKGDDGSIDPFDIKDNLHPFVLSCRCRLHSTDETFVYFSEQEDANNHDDFFDLVYIGSSIRCQPVLHPGLARFREESA